MRRQLAIVMGGVLFLAGRVMAEEERQSPKELVSEYANALVALGDLRGDYELQFKHDPKTGLPLESWWAYRTLARTLVENGKRDAGVRFLDKIIPVLDFEQGVTETRWRIADTEKDDAAKENIYRQWLDSAVALGESCEHVSVLRQAEFGKRLLPEYLKKLESSPKLGALYHYLLAEYSYRPE